MEKLKTTPRKGWINVGVQHPESIADHMYRMSVITMLCTDETLDKGKMQKIALVHDMAEASKSFHMSLFPLILALY